MIHPVKMHVFIQELIHASHRFFKEIFTWAGPSYSNFISSVSQIENDKLNIICVTLNYFDSYRKNEAKA